MQEDQDAVSARVNANCGPERDTGSIVAATRGDAIDIRAYHELRGVGETAGRVHTGHDSLPTGSGSKQLILGVNMIASTPQRREDTPGWGAFEIRTNQKLDVASPRGVRVALALALFLAMFLQFYATTLLS